MNCNYRLIVMSVSNRECVESAQDTRLIDSGNGVQIRIRLTITEA
jgi:hypothetical protein